MLQIWYFFLDRFRFTYLVLLGLIAAGAASIVILPREASPEVVVPIGVVTTVYPGASPLDVERLITDEIENAVENLDELDSFTSTSREGVSTVVVNFEASADVDDRIRALRDAVTSVESELPGDANDPMVSEVSFSDQPIVVFGLAADIPEAELKHIAEQIQDEIESMNGISEVLISGAREEEVILTVDKRRLDQYGLNINDLVSAVQAGNATLPIGSIQTDEIRYAVRMDAELASPEELEALPVRQVEGVPVYLRDIASVSYDLAEAQTRSRVSENGEPSVNAVTLSIRKKSGGDITKLVAEARLRAEALLADSYPEAKLIVTFDAGEEVRKSLSDLSGNGIATVIIIAFLLWVFLGSREALLAGLSVPITFLIGFIGLVVFDSSINFLSLFSLILALGIVVDNGIVITEGMHDLIRKGVDPRQAAKATVKEFQWPLISGTLTTVSAFLPMLFMSGIMGQFVRHIPITVNMVLVGSLMTALGILPLLGSRFLRHRDNKPKETVNQKYIAPRMEKLHDWYEAKIRNFLADKRAKKRFTWTFVFLFFAAMALPITGALPVIMFGENNADFFYIDIEAPIGSTLDVTDRTVLQVEEKLYEDSRIESFFVDIGRGNPLAEVPSSGAHLASFTVNVDPEREEPMTEIIKQYREQLAFITEADVNVTQIDAGPPGGAPVQVAFRGPDLSELERLANDAAVILEEIGGTTQVETSVEETAFEFVLSVDRQEAIRNGFTPFQIGSALRTAVQGTEATEIRIDGDDVDVVVQQSLNPQGTGVDDRTVTTINEIEQMVLTAPDGRQVPIASLADIRLAPGRNVINHTDGEREATATSQVEGTTPTAVFDAFEQRLGELGIPEGYTVKLGGEAEDIQESFRDLFQALFIGIFLIAAILLLQFNSYRQPFFILVSLPLSLIGVFFGLLLVGQPLSFPAFIGIVALSGVVVNDAIILIDKINSSRKEGMPKLEAIVQAGRSRLQPILLTTITTISGILPLTLSDPTWGSLGASIIFGLLFATVLTLAVVPMLYLRFGEETLD